MSPGGLRGLQLRRGALKVSSVGSTPMRPRQKIPTALFYFLFDAIIYLAISPLLDVPLGIVGCLTTSFSDSKVL